jgi:AraC-like DNA-binding protein
MFGLLIVVLEIKAPGEVVSDLYFVNYNSVRCVCDRHGNAMYRPDKLIPTLTERERLARMRTLRALWIQITAAVNESASTDTFQTWCDVSYWSDLERLEERIVQDPEQFDLAIFDYDYPDRTGLRLLRSTKTDFPSLPIIMLTTQHSEALAVWAFRSKVWDYLVKPVAKRDVQRCMVSLSRALAERKQQPPRRPAAQADKIPDEVAFVPKADNHALGPALHFIEKNFRCAIKSESVAASCNMSPFRFSRLFKETFGITFRDYLINYRLREAYRLFENPRVTVADVAFAVGFSDPSYFARVFKQRLGAAPSSLIGHARSESFCEQSLPLPNLQA